MDNSRIFTVSEINASIRGILESQFPFISVAGEISNLRQPLSGHMYFTLKDDQSQIKAVLFKMQQRYLSDMPADGRLVICRGRISVYEPRGDYQLIVDVMESKGRGLLQIEFEKLKMKLAEEGLFSPERKKQLPSFPGHVTLVTSPNGAAVHDFLRVAASRFPLTRIAVFPVPVQGDQASGEIAKAIDEINRSLVTDIIVVCRGGGSIEDLWTFNEEKVARAIAASLIPVVSAVGHEIDYTIADLAADLRAPTPSAAAELILPDSGAIRQKIAALNNRLARNMTATLDRHENKISLQRHRLTGLKQRFDKLLIRLDHLSEDLEKAMQVVLVKKQWELEQAARILQANNPIYQMNIRSQKINDLHRRLVLAVRRKIEESQEVLGHAAGMLDAVSPLATLARGYSIVRKDSPAGEVVTDYREVETGEKVDVTLHKGRLECRVEKK